MDESDVTSDDPFADVAPVPDWDDLPDPDVVPASSPTPSPPSISTEPVSPPPLPPPLAGPAQPHSAVVDDEPTDPEPARVLPVEVPTAATEPVSEQFEFPPGFFGEPEPEPEPEPAPVIDLSSRDTAGLVSTIAGPALWIAGLGTAWYFLTRQPDPVLTPETWPTPGTTWDALLDLAQDGDARTTVWDSMQRLLAAVAAGAIAGLLVGSLTGRRRIVRNLLRPAVAAFRVVSPFVLLVFLFTWRGDPWWVEWTPAAAGVAALTAWTTDRALSTSRPRATTISGPTVLRGVRASLILAWTLVFATEQALGLNGIFTAMASSTDTMPVAVAWLAVAAAVAALVEAVLRLVEHLLARG